MDAGMLNINPKNARTIDRIFLFLSNGCLVRHVDEFIHRAEVGSQDHSGLMAANLITLAHLSMSSAMSLPKSAAEPGIVVPPCSSFALSVGSASPALISLF